MYCYKKVSQKLFLIIFLVCFALPTYSITNGEPDGNAHPHVGLVVLKDASGIPLQRCSGTLIAPQLFLTAGHCTHPPTASATIWFEEDIDTGIPENGYPYGGPTSVDGEVYTHPDYDSEGVELHDLGMVVLDEPVYAAAYGMLPELGQLDSLKTKRGQQDTTFVAVGYGIQRINPVFMESKVVRLKATLRLVSLIGTGRDIENWAVLLSSNTNTGGICFGDSGGPLFAGDSNVIVAITAFGVTANCAGVGVGYRLDTIDDLNWIYSQFGDLLDF